MKDTIKILMVDDDIEDYLITESLLGDIGRKSRYVIDWLPEYEKGREEILKCQHDIYLIDYMIGKHNGLDLIEEARSSGCDAPLILLTGQAYSEIDEQAILVGASDFLIKGKQTGELLERTIRYELRNCENLRKINNLNHELEARVKERTHRLTEAVKTLAEANIELEKTLTEKEKMESALKESQEIYNTIAQKFPAGLICMLNTERDFMFIEGSEIENNRCLSHNLIGTSFFNIVPEEYYESTKNLIEQSEAGISTEFEFELDKKMYSVNIQPLQDKNGRIYRFLIVMKNITHQKQIEESIRKALQKEIELNELKSRFVTMASHEFRTPLSAIATSLSLLNTYIKPSPESPQAKHIKRINFSIKQLVEILNDFLSLEKLEQGKIEKTSEKFNLRNLATGVSEELESILKPGQTITLHYCGEEDICLDRKISQNIFLNLLSNAIKYSSEGDEIELHIEVTKEDVQIIVKDHGIGIPEKDQTMLFSRFFRAQNATNIQGTGLGLNIVKRYVQLLNGNIDFISKENEGTTFRVKLERQSVLLA